MGDIVNLRDFRKQRAKQEKSEKAAVNRRKHGRTKAEAERDKREREQRDAILDSKRIDGDDES